MEQTISSMLRFSLVSLSAISTLGVLVSIIMLAIQLYNAYKYNTPIESYDTELIPERHIKKAIVFIMVNCVSIVSMMILSRTGMILKIDSLTSFSLCSVICSMILLLLVITSKIVKGKYNRVTKVE